MKPRRRKYRCKSCGEEFLKSSGKDAERHEDCGGEGKLVAHFGEAVHLFWKEK